MTDVPLREYVERIFDEREKALTVALAGQQEALRVASKELESRLATLNELREDVTKDRVLLISRAEYEAKHSALQAQVEALAEALTSDLKGVRAGLDGRLSGLESWRLRATGVFLVLLPIAGLIGAAVARALS